MIKVIEKIIMSSIRCLRPDQNLKKRDGSVDLVIHMTNASVVWSGGNTDKMHQFIVAVITRALDRGLMVDPEQSVSLREFPKWFLDSNITANKGWAL